MRAHSDVGAFEAVAERLVAHRAPEALEVERQAELLDVHSRALTEHLSATSALLVQAYGRDLA